MQRITQLIKTHFTLYQVYDFIIYIKFLVFVSTLDFLTNFPTHLLHRLL